MGRVVVWAAAMAAIVGGACASTGAPPTELGTGEALGEVAINTPPPPPERDAAPPAPDPDYGWIEGYWSWGGDQHFQWIPGRWVPPRDGWVWIPNRWVWSDQQWHWRAGHWRRG